MVGGVVREEEWERARREEIYMRGKGLATAREMETPWISEAVNQESNSAQPTGCLAASKVPSMAAIWLALSCNGEAEERDGKV